MTTPGVTEPHSEQQPPLLRWRLLVLLCGLFFLLLLVLPDKLLPLGVGTQLQRLGVTTTDLRKGLLALGQPWHHPREEERLNTTLCAPRAPQQQPPPQNPCLPDVCAFDEYTVWEEWKACTEQRLAREAPARDPRRAFEQFIVQHRAHLPWSLGSNFTAILVDFRPWVRQLSFSIRNALDNLPVPWRVQVLGGPSVVEVVQARFPVEVEAGKIVSTLVGPDSYYEDRRGKVRKWEGGSG